MVTISSLHFSDHYGPPLSVARFCVYVDLQNKAGSALSYRAMLYDLFLNLGLTKETFVLLSIFPDQRTGRLYFNDEQLFRRIQNIVTSYRTLRRAPDEKNKAWSHFCFFHPIDLNGRFTVPNR